MQPQPLTVLKKRQKKWLSNYPSIQVITNQYQTRVNDKYKYFRIFTIKTEPQVQKDSYHIFAQAVKNMPQDVKKSIKCEEPFRRGDTVWCMSQFDLTHKQQQKLKRIPPKYRLRVNTQDYQISINLVKQSDMNCQQYRHLITQLLNVRLKQLVLKKCQFKQLSRNVYFPKNSVFIRNERQALQARTGYKFSLSYLEILLFCDLNNQTKVMSQKRFLEILYEKRNKPQYYIGKRVMKAYGDQKTFVIQSIDFKLSPQTYTFERQGKKTTLFQYYKKCYQIQIYDLKQPLIVVSSNFRKQPKNGQKMEKIKQSIYLVPQLVCLVGIPQTVGRNFLKQIRMSPNDQIKQANQFIKQVNTKQQQFKIEYENRRGIAHLLPQPRLRVNTFTTIQPQNGSIKITNQINQPIQLKDVLIVHSVGNEKTYDRNSIDKIVNLFNEAGKRYKIQIKQKFQLEIKRHSPPQTWISQIIKDCQKNGKPFFIILALTRQEEQIKEIIKKYLTYQLKVESQAFLRSKFEQQKKNPMNIAGNICKQIAAKKGHSLWQLKQVYGFEQKTVLQIGISVQKCGPKFQCVIGRNINKQITKYVFQRFQTDTKQISSQFLSNYFYKAIQDYVKTLKSKPSTIIVYRMGYNNENYAPENLQKQYQILKERVQFIVEKKFKNKYQPELVYIQVFDRPAHKYYLKEQGHQNGTFLPKVLNPQPGTVMRGLTDNDFYLISYTCRQGSAQPALYRVLNNQKQVKMQFLSQFTYAQCYMYWNWQGAIRLPAILQYCKAIHRFVKPQSKDLFEFKGVEFI